MITRTFSFGFVFALSSRSFATYVSPACTSGAGAAVAEVGTAAGAGVLPLPGAAVAARGAASAHTAMHMVAIPRPPLPQRTEDRESPPRLPVPHNALERSPRSAAPRSLLCDIHSPSLRAWRGPQFKHRQTPV